MFIAINTFLGLVLVLSGIMLIRNKRVFTYRRKIIDAMYNRNVAGIDAKEDWKVIQARHGQYESVSYDRMVLMFWKPLDSFYDPEFLKEIGV